MTTSNSLQNKIRSLSPLAAIPLVLLLAAFAPPNTSPQASIDLAARLTRQARDTQNPADFREAGAAAAKALTADPESFDARRYQAMAMLGQQDLTGALTLATALNKRIPDDIGVWALLAEIQSDRGDYAEAERCTQWILDLRRNSPLGFSTAARLREVYGDYDGAAEFYAEALRRTAQSDTDERSWLMVQSARVLLRANNLAAAASFLVQAEQLSPNSLQVAAQKAELARAKGDFEQAATLLATVSEKSPTPEHLYSYALALERAGKRNDAQAIYSKLEKHPAADSVLIFYYADQKKDPEQALALATRQLAARQDIATLDADAWALYRAGRFTEARTQIDKVLAIGTRDPNYVCHAFRIASETRTIDSAAAHLPEGACELIPVKTALSFLLAVSLAFAQRITPLSAKPETTDQKIRRNETVLKANAKDLAAELELTAAYLQKLRENGDGTFLDRASTLVDRILTQDPGNYEAMRFQNEIDLQKHDFKAVEDRARDLLRFEPSDAGAWGNLADASMELGKYEAAGQAYAKMFAIRPSLASYNRIAWFRFVTGDTAGAIQFMQEAVAAGAGTPENTAWCTAELGDIYFKAGKLDDAMAAYNSALSLFPALHRALAGKGRVEAARGNTAAAIGNYERAQAIVPMIDYAAALEDLYTTAGKPEKARQQRDMIDVIDRLGAARGESTNRNLAIILADHHRNMAHALELVEREIVTRPDVYAWDALSWVLFQSGRIDEAKAASANAMKFNTPEPKFHEHAAMIAATQKSEHKEMAATK